MTEIGHISALEALEKRLREALAVVATKADIRTEANRVIEAWHAARAKP